MTESNITPPSPRIPRVFLCVFFIPCVLLCVFIPRVCLHLVADLFLLCFSLPRMRLRRCMLVTCRPGTWHDDLSIVHIADSCARLGRHF